MNGEASRAAGGGSGEESVQGLRCGVWWLSPAWASFLVVGPSLLWATLAKEETFLGHWGTPKYLTSSQSLWFAACLGVFVLFTRVAARARSSQAARIMQVTEEEASLVQAAGRVLFWLTVFGYVAWICIAIARNADLALVRAVLEGDVGACSRLKRHLHPVAGITTFTQFAAPAVVCLMADRRISGRRNTLLICLLVTLGAVRALLYAERLALVEVLVPMLVVQAAWPTASRGRRRQLGWALLPVAAPLAMATIFGAYEYVRSWAWASRDGRHDLLPYMLNRLSAYYATPYNNSALILEHIAPRLRLPYYTVDWFWSFPLTRFLLDRNQYLGVDPDALWADIRVRYANPEFNNQGFAGPQADYGYAGALLWWAVVGLLIGMCYQTMRAGRLSGLLLYAVIYAGLLEMPRYHYWAQGRATPALAAGLILVFLLSRARNAAAGAAVSQQVTSTPLGRQVRRESMSIRHIRHLYHNVMQQIWCIVVGLLVGALGAAGLTMLMTTTYRSTTAIYVYVPRPSAGLGDAYQGTLYTQQQVRAYGDLVRTEAIIQPVANKLGLPHSKGKLKDQVSVDVPLDSVVLGISAVDRSPKQAARIANAFAAELTNYVNNLEMGARSGQVQLKVVDSAQPDNDPYSPNLPLNLALGMLGGAFLGLGLGTAVSRLDTRIKTAHQLTTVVPCPILASIPTDLPTGGPSEQRKINCFSSYAESYRKLRANLSFLGTAQSNRTFLVTSPSVGEGKSTIALDLARTLADSGARCLLIDADLRRPSVAARLNLIGDVGLSSVLAGLADIEAVLQEHEGLTVLASGPTPPNPAELLGSESMIQLLKSLSDRFDRIIIDTAPLLPVADTRMLVSRVDGVILVARQRKSRTEELAEAVGALDTAGARLVGAVHNGSANDARGYGYGNPGDNDAHQASTSVARPELMTGKSVLILQDRGRRRAAKRR
ncbi:polysaccharide biosynthesis tyrosine autokinase [Streptomyces mirabilis]|uniref:polysaccharide biosynthesis tyrosine autokinase n=1 Tax=Streptomyces mirabilis TaxID=68239 RepID=UPI0033D54E5A